MYQQANSFLQALREEIDARIKDDRSIEDAVKLIALTDDTEKKLYEFLNRIVFHTI